MAINNLQDTPGFKPNPVVGKTSPADEVTLVAPPVEQEGVPPASESAGEGTDRVRVAQASTEVLPTPTDTPSIQQIGTQPVQNESTQPEVSTPTPEPVTPVPEQPTLPTGDAYVSVLAPTPASPTESGLDAIREVFKEEVSAEIGGSTYTSVIPQQLGYAVVDGEGDSKASSFSPRNATKQALKKAGETTSHMEIAQAYLGFDERDKKGAAALSEFFKQSGGIDLDPSTTAWCAAFMNGVLGEAGLGGTGAVNARSFLKYGTPVDEPQVGDVVVFSRGDPNGWQGHVGLIAGVNKNGTIDVLGGNQSTDTSGARGVTVNVRNFGTDRVLGYRRPIPQG